MALKGKARTIIRLFVVLAAIVWYWNKHRVPEAHHAGPDAAAVAVTPVPAKPMPMRHWRLGDLDLASCELPHRNSGATTAAWCTDFDVAEDPEQPGGRHIGLRVAVIRSDAAAPDPDIVVMITGGPGEASTEDFADTGVYKGVLKHRNVLLVDQRGTGHSNPLDCDNARKEAGAPSDPDSVRKSVGACLLEVQKIADPRFYTTTIAVEDLEKLRQALGAPLLDLYGVSYGTRVAQHYAIRHPDGVRAIVLDSPAPNQVVLGQDFAASLDLALKRDFADCIAAPACDKAFGDPMVTLHKLRESLRSNPRDVTMRDPRNFEIVSHTLTPARLTGLVRLFAYAPETAALLPLSIDAAARGDFTPLVGQERLLEGDLAGAMNGGMSMSVVCSEESDLLRERPEDADTILGNQLIATLRAQCDIWPHGSMPADFHAPLKTGKPVLILSGERDPVTPPDYGKQILDALPKARQLVLKGQGHGALNRGCTPKLFERFIDDPDPGKLDADCLDRLGPIPALIDFNGAAP